VQYPILPLKLLVDIDAWLIWKQPPFLSKNFLSLLQTTEIITIGLDFFVLSPHSFCAGAAPGFVPLVESDQKTLKVGIHSFPALCSALKRVSVKKAGKFTSCVLGQGT